MTREIKFRAFQTHYKEMYQPLVGYIEFPEVVVGFDDGDIRLEGEAVILMQFTGLLDRNGKEIYEGDIVRILYTDWISKSINDTRTLEEYKIAMSNIKEVVFEAAEWKLKSLDTFYSIHYGQYGFIEVIGNIYENPELITNTPSI